MEPTLPILYQDEHLVAVDKPSGLFVHRSALTRGVRQFAVQRLRRQLGTKVHPIHRLDRATSGVLLFGLDPETTSAVSAQFAAGRVAKRYCAVVRGHPPEGGVIDHPVAPAKDDRKRDAITHFRRLRVAEIDAAVGRYSTARYALLALAPQSGRRHQLRRHCAHLAHPIIGDTTYGDRFHNRYFRQALESHRLLLVSMALRVVHPVTGADLNIEAPWPPDLMAISDALGWSAPKSAELSALEMSEESLGDGDHL